MHLPLMEKLTEELELEMIKVEGGTFEMGRDDFFGYTPHGVQLDTFYIGKYPVTQAQWQAVMGNNPSFFQGADRPVECVSWHDAQKFIQKLSTLRGRVYRLPTEAEWEYAACGGKRTKGYLYAGSNDLNDVGWYGGNSHKETKAVGLKFPNELGLYDMSGNVYEWCEDKGRSLRVVRGGGWGNPPQRCRVASRSGNAPEYRYSGVGFRLAFSLQSAG